MDKIVRNHQPIFKRLHRDELISLQTDFIQFLATQGIAADDWVKYQKDDADKVDYYICLFSDSIYKKTLNETSHIQRVSRDSVQCILYLTNKKIAVTFTIRNPSVDLRTLNLFDPSIYTPELKAKIVLKQGEFDEAKRLDEIFAMLENGYLISDRRLFEYYCLIHDEN